jgi:hypothetical protein
LFSMGFKASHQPSNKHGHMSKFLLFSLLDTI